MSDVSAIMTNCPTEEILAAFIDGRLDHDARGRVVEHVAECGECRSTIIIASNLSRAALTSDRSTVIHFTARKAFTAAAAAFAAAAIVIVLFGPALREMVLPADGGIEALVKASQGLETQPFEGRLSGGFPAKRPKRVTRGSGADSAPLGLLAAAATIEEATAKSRSADNLHALGMSLLLLGKYDDAIKTLEEALVADAHADDFIDALSRSKNVALLIDVSAAYQARGRHRNRTEDFVVALEAAERAWSLKKTPEAAWNRALAIESLPMRGDALSAWNDYLALDSTSAWADLARERVRDLKTPAESELWDGSKNRLRQAVRAGDRAAIASVVNRFPQQARTWAEDELLVEWAIAATRHDARVAGDNLMTAGAIGDALQDRAKDALLHDSVAAIRRDGVTLASAHIGYRAAQWLQREQRMREASISWRSVSTQLHQHRSPLWVRATVFEASATYYAGERESAAQLLVPIFDDVSLRERYPSAIGQAYWLRALMRCSAGKQAEGIRDYRVAIGLFERVGEIDNVAAIHNRLATNLSYIGQSVEAWRHRAEAFRILDRNGNDTRIQALLVDSARAAEDAGLMLAALRFHDRLVRSFRSSSDSVGFADALRARSITRWKAGKTNGAIADLRSAISTTATISDASMRERVLANVRSAESMLYRESQPERATLAATEAIGIYERIGNHLRLADMYMERALGYRARDFPHAVRDLHMASAVLEEQRADLRTPSDRQAFLDRRKTLFERGVGLFVAHGDLRGALSFGEISRARSILDAGDRATSSPLNAEEIEKHMPRRTALLSYAILKDRLVISIVTRGATHGSVQDVSARKLHHLVIDTIEACESLADDRCRETSATLYDILIRPVAALIEPRLAVVPDGVLHAVALSALFDRQSGRYLIEDHELMIAPSASIFIRHQQRLQLRYSEAVIIGNPTFDVTLHPELPGLLAAESEVRKIAGFYSNASIITGAAATKAELVNAIQRGALIHFAGHAVFEPLDATQNALILAPTRGDDGRLSAAEISRMRMSNVPLVVLSACGTWKSVDAGSGPLGFAEVFLRAGVGMVVASLSPVNDAEVSPFIVAFHETLQVNSDAATALRYAQLRFLHNTDLRLRAPRVWSSFVVII
jgi:CHAT domain-containing protein/tetratricopeptide (TPR) repeat protein